MIVRIEKGFSEEIGELRVSGEERERDEADLKLLPDKMAIKFNVLGLFVKMGFWLCGSQLGCQKEEKQAKREKWKGYPRDEQAR